MNQIVVIAGIVGMGAVVAVIVALRARSVLRHTWTGTSTLIFLAGLVGSLPTALSNLLDPQEVTYDAFGAVNVGLRGWAEQLQYGLIALCPLAAGVLVLARWRRAPVSPAAWLAILVVIAGIAGDIVNGHASDLSVRVIALIALLVASSVGEAGRPAHLGAAAVVLLYAMLGVAQTLLHPEAAFRECRADKCGPGGGLYVGAFTNENSFGLVLALGLPFVWLASRGKSRVLLTSYLLAVIACTGSRTAQVAALGTAGVMILLSIVGRWPQMLTGRRLFLLIVTGAVGISAGLPLAYAYGWIDVGDRGEFWDVASQHLVGSPLLGLGATGWERLYSTGEIPIAASYSPHNQWVDLAVAGGLIGVLAFLALIGHLALRSPTATGVSALVLVPVLLAATLERPWSFAANDALTFTLLAALLCVPTLPAGSGERLAAYTSPPARALGRSR